MPQTITQYSSGGIMNVMERLRAWARSDQNGAALPQVLAISGTVPPPLSYNVPARDWDILFRAINTRLRSIVGEHMNATLEPYGNAGLVRSGVLECAAALDQLHRTLTHELALRQQLELEILTTKAALAQVRADLIGTQAGERLARYQALHDHLTALPNRLFFYERLNEALYHAEPEHQTLAVLSLDLDDFKLVNDRHGHGVGDELLKIVAARLTRTLRTKDMVARLGGDEFVCLISELPNREQLCHLAKKLLGAVSAPIKIGEIKLSIRVSIGIALCPGDGLSAEALLKNADTAMYQAKRAKTGHAFFDQCVSVNCA